MWIFLLLLIIFASTDLRILWCLVLSSQHTFLGMHARQCLLYEKEVCDNYIIICHTYMYMYLCSVDLGWSFPSATRPCSTHRLHCNRVSKCPDGIPDDLFRLPQLQGTSKKACCDDVLNFIVLAPLRSYLWSADKDVFEAVTINYYTQKPLFYPEEFQEAANALLMVYFGFQQDSISVENCDTAIDILTHHMHST